MYQRILVPYDGSPTSSRGLDEAIHLASLCGASLRLMYMVDDLLLMSGFETIPVYVSDMVPLMREAGDRILAEGRERAEKAGLKVDTTLIEGVAVRLADVVIDQVRGWGAELVVIGTHGRRGIGRLVLGSDAEQIVRTAPVPVLLVRAPQDDATSTLDANLRVATA